MSTTLSAHVEAFISARTYSPNSARQRRIILAMFVAHLGDPPAGSVTAGQVLDWWHSTERLRPASRKAHISAVRTFIGYLVSINVMQNDPTCYISTPRIPPKPPVVLTERQIMDVLRHANTAREQAAVSLMLGCGMRSCEVAWLRVENIDIARRVLTVMGKGGKVREIPMPVATVACVMEMMRYVPSSGPLIRRQRGEGGVHPSTARHLVDSVLRRAGVKREAFDGRSSHVLRRTCATVLLESGASIKDVQEILGHATLSSTMPYLGRGNIMRLVADVIDLGPLPDDLSEAA